MLFVAFSHIICVPLHNASTVDDYGAASTICFTGGRRRNK
jgi:hypothetical protein